MSEKDQETPGETEAQAPGEDAAPETSRWQAGAAEADAARIAALEAEVAEHKDHLLRTLAEMENLRKRTQREKDDATRFAITRFARDIISVSDDLTRAIEAVPEEARHGDDNPVAQLVAGIELTERQLQQVFERHGVRRFSPEGEKFDPTFHEAMFEYPDPERPAGTVAQVVEVGYMIGDRVLRPARVGVSVGGPKLKEQAEPQAGESPAETPDSAAEPEAPKAPETPEAQTEEAPAPPQQPEAPKPEHIGIKIDRSA